MPGFYTTMLMTSLSQTLSQIFSPPFRTALWKSIGLTLAMMIVLWFVLQALSTTFLIPFVDQYSWAATAITWLLGTGLVLGMGFLIAPVTSVFAGVFLDDIADEVETKHYPQDTLGKPLSLVQSTNITIRFLGLVLIGNFFALLLVLFFGLGFLIFFVLNGYLLGREYFQFAGLRHRPMNEIVLLRKKFSLEIFLAGMMIAIVLSIPFVNLMTPLFAGALMVHVYKGLEQKMLKHASGSK